MLIVLTETEFKAAGETAIQSIDRLNELVTVKSLSNEDGLLKIIVEDSQVKFPIDWYDNEPPIVFPDLSFERNNLLAAIFYKLGNHQKAFEFIEETNPFYLPLLITISIQFGYLIPPETVSKVRDSSKHNFSIVHHFGHLEERLTLEQLKEAYKATIQETNNAENQAFTCKQYVSLLLDNYEYEKAGKVLDNLIVDSLSEEALLALNTQKSALGLATLTIPYEESELNRLLKLQLKTIEGFEQKSQRVHAGLLLLQASEVCSYKKDYIQAKLLVSKATQYFRDEGIPEFMGEAALKKAILLYAWSKDGSPQYSPSKIC